MSETQFGYIIDDLFIANFLLGKETEFDVIIVWVYLLRIYKLGFIKWILVIIFVAEKLFSKFNP